MRRRSAALITALTLTATLLPAHLASAQAVEYTVVDPAEGFTDDPDAGTDRAGVVPDGPVEDADSAWRMQKPDDWNGILVLYAHGFVSPVQKELVVQNWPLAPAAVPLGFAWAASSYSENGYVIEDPIDETHALIQTFLDEYGLDPSALQGVIINGFSMGGHITAAAIEEYPTSFVGALPACGAVGDIVEFDHLSNQALLSQAAAGLPGVLPDDPSYLGEVLPASIGLLGLQGPLTTAGHRYAALTEQGVGGEMPLFDEAFAFWNSGPAALGDARIPFTLGVAGGALTGGAVDPRVTAAFGNSDTDYRLSTSFDDDATPVPAAAAINASVLRKEATADPYFPQVAGEIPAQVKVLSIHGLGDQFVPFSHEQAYASRVADNGGSDRLVTRAIRGLGHCTFTPIELGTAFNDLVTWILGGPTPAGDDVLDPVAVAHRDFGCQFTDQVTPVPDRAGLRDCEDAVSSERRSGPTRIETALAVSSSWPTADTVLLARSDTYADALTGSALAGALGAPILLTPSDALDPDVAERIAELGATTVILLGGETALSPAVADAFDDDVTVQRIEGADRFATAAAIAAAVVEAAGDQDQVYLAKGRDDDPTQGFADAIAVSGLAAFRGIPILLTDTTTMPDATSTAISTLDPSLVTIVGGPSAVPSSLEDAIDADTERLAGDTRYETSLAVALRSDASGMSLNRPWIATGQSFPDGIVAGPAAARAGQVLALVRGDGDGATQDDTGLPLELTGRTTDLTIVGGTVAINGDVGTALTRSIDAMR